MTRTKTPEKAEEIKGIRASIMQNAMSVNKYLTKAYLQGKSNEELLCFCHPMYRQDFATKLGITNKKEWVDPEYN